MKKLTLIRHAKAEDPTLHQKDFDRALSHKGLKQAARIAQQLKEQRFTCDAIFTSTALRALTTARTIGQNTLSAQQTLHETDDLYTFDSEQLYRFIELIDDNIQHAVIVGHNPALSLLLSELVREPVQNMSTCSVAELELAIDEWVDIHPGCAKLLNQLTPKSLQ